MTQQEFIEAVAAIVSVTYGMRIIKTHIGETSMTIKFIDDLQREFYVHSVTSMVQKLPDDAIQQVLRQLDRQRNLS